MSTVVGLAIPVTIENAEKLSIHNAGQPALIVDDSFFVLPLEAGLQPRQIPGYAFRASWAFAAPRSTDYFVPIVEIGRADI